MAAGLKANNVLSSDTGVSWEDLFSINAGGLTNATRDNFLVQIKTHKSHTWAEVLYLGTGALTLTEIKNLPLGSIIHCPALTTPAMYYKVAAAGTSTWKYQAVNT